MLLPFIFLAAMRVLILNKKMTIPTTKQEPEYVVEGISELTGGWGD